MFQRNIIDWGKFEKAKTSIPGSWSFSHTGAIFTIKCGKYFELPSRPLFIHCTLNVPPHKRA